MNVESIVYYYFFGFITGVCSFVYSTILTSEGMILSWMPSKVSSIFYSVLPKWAARIAIKVLIGCSVCIAGQASTWIYVFTPGGYSVIHHIICSCVAMCTAWVFVKIDRAI